MRYIVLHSQAQSSMYLEQSVINYMKEGWKPQGGVSAIITDAPRMELLWTQAMVKEDD